MNWLYFLSPFILKDKTTYYNRIIKEIYIDEIAIYCGISVVLINAGYFLFFNRTIQPLSSIKLRFKDDILKRLIYIFIISGLIFRGGERVFPAIVNALSNLIQILPYSPTIVFGFYLLYLYRTRTRPSPTFFHISVFSFLFLEFLIRLSTTLFSEIIILFAGVLLVYFREKGKIPILAMGLSLLVLYPLYQTRKYFRVYSDEAINFEGSRLEKGELLLNNAYSLGEQKDAQKDYQKLQKAAEDFNRFENLSFISHVVLQHKKGIKPFLNGETFYWLPLVPIPRVLYPSKPQNLMSTEVATQYGLRGKISTASINFPMLVEGYINYDFSGMLFMAFLFGLAYKWFVMKFGMGLGDVNLLIIINSIKQFTHAEGNITLVFGALIQVFLFWLVIVWFFKLDANNKLFYEEDSSSI
jgi:hypothetical protein